MRSSSSGRGDAWNGSLVLCLDVAKQLFDVLLGGDQSFVRSAAPLGWEEDPTELDLDVVLNGRPQGRDLNLLLIGTVPVPLKV